MTLADIHDKIEKILNKKQLINTSDIDTILCLSWEEAKLAAKKITLKPGWAVYFIRENNFVDHIAIVPHQKETSLNLFDAVLLNSTPSPLGMGIGPMTNDKFDRSGLRILTAIEYIELFETGYYQKILVGPPPSGKEHHVKKAGLIAREIAETGLIDGKSVVYSFSNIPIIKNFYVKYFSLQKNGTKIGFMGKKFRKNTFGLYCGLLVAEIWKRSGISDIPQLKVLGMKSFTSFSLFKWSKDAGSIISGIHWKQI